MPNKSATHATEKGSAVVRKPPVAARASRRPPAHGHSPAVLARAINTPASELSAGDIRALQRTAGNRAVAEILAQSVPPQPSRLTIQAKLAVGAADDQYEREADRVAAEVMQPSAPPAAHIQRQPSPETEDEEKLIQRKPLAASITPLVQRQELAEKEDEEEKPVQRRGVGTVTSAGASVERGIEQARASGQQLPDPLRARMEQAFGADFSRVRVHADSESDHLNRALQAKAFTTGQDLFFRRGDYNPDSRKGQELIAHELTHVVQQSGGTTGNRRLSVQRAPSHVIQRSVTEAIEEDRMSWKMMPTSLKVAMVPLAPFLGPFVQAWESGKKATSQVYNSLAGDNPGIIRAALSGLVAGGTGLLGSVYGLAKGFLRGLTFGIGNPLYSIGKRVAKFSLDEARGIYEGAEPPEHEKYGGQRKNYNYDTKKDLLNYGLLTLGAGSAVGKTIADKVSVISAMGGLSYSGNVWDKTKTFFTGSWDRTKAIFSDSTPVASETGKILSSIGAASSGLGAVTSLMDAKKGFSEGLDSANTRAQRGLGISAGLSGTLGAAQQSATSAYHIANATGNNLLALGAQSATGGLAVATGAVDIVRGTLGYFKAASNIERLKKLEKNKTLTEDTKKAVEQAASTQANRKTSSIGTGLKGALSVAGGALLLASTATPIGWLLLTAGALVGGIFAISKWWDKRKRKKEIAIKVFDIEDERKKWEEDVARVKKDHWFWDSAGKAKREALGPDPLERELKAHKFKDVGHFYANYINKMAHDLYDTAQADRNSLALQASRQLSDARGDYRTFAILPKELTQARLKADVQKFIKKEKIMIPEGNNLLQIMELIESMGLKFDWLANPVQPTPEKIAKALEN
ncbi:MAG: DUF4157 domain-containing protein [Blastocatellia bacterium]